MCFQRVLLNIKKNIVMEKNISVQITSKKVLHNQFSFQFNTNLKIDKTKTFIIKKTDIDFSTDIKISIRSMTNIFRYTNVN